MPDPSVFLEISVMRETIYYLRIFLFVLFIVFFGKSIFPVLIAVTSIKIYSSNNN